VGIFLNAENEKFIDILAERAILSLVAMLRQLVSSVLLDANPYHQSHLNLIAD
jgi:hypothetical protein